MSGRTESEDHAGLLRVCGHPLRLRLLSALVEGPASSRQLAERTGAASVAVGQHLRCLRLAGLVERRNGTYRVVEEALAGLVTSLLSYLGPTQDSGELPLPPAACLQCYNNVYVLGLLARLARQVREAQEQEERLRRLSAQVMRAQEEERKRVARELHDDTAQALTALLVHLRVLENSAPDDETRRRLRELRELTSSTLEGVRRLALDLRPSALDHFGLTAALAASAEEFSKRWGIPVHLSLPRLEERLPPDVELALYRTTQEALSNVAKHARASRVSIALRRLGERLVLRVKDDGRGFRPEEVMASRERGLGLFGMQERLALVGGSLEIRSRPGAGTEVLAQVPLARPRPARVHAHEGTRPPGG